MATWITHMRIAEYFMKLDERLDSIEFLVGNIGPDCGKPNEDWSKFTPDGSITHWKSDGKNIDAEDFRQKFVHLGEAGYDFYLGYYFHLLTDILFHQNIYQQKIKEPLYYEGLDKDPNFIWTIKKDWYGQDFIFLLSNPDSVFFKRFQHIKDFENTYFDFYPDDAFIRQIEYITDAYLTTDVDTKREFPYLSKTEMDTFVDATIEFLEEVYRNM